ncbi:MAG: GDP-mannose 4,6-dehydratase [Oceanospirillaceae bacterium]|nr:GDP-mannose 4,6-dehydratase [Oceanospirillaceae bacterium]
MVKSVQPDYVVHLAAVSFVNHHNVSDIYVANIVATTNLLDALISQNTKVKKVLIASSGNVYGNPIGLPIDEKAQFIPENDYGVSKVAMEYAARLRMRRLPIVIARPFNYTGFGQSEKFLVPKIVAAFKRHDPVLELGNLDVARDFSDVRDVVSAYVRILRSNVEGEVFNVCSGKSVPLREVIRICNKLTGHHP